MKFQKGNFFHTPNKHLLRSKSPQLQCIYMRICSFANEEGECYPSINLLADCTGCCRSVVIGCIKELTRLGILDKKNRFNGNEQMTNLYQVVAIECISQTLPSVGDNLPSVGDNLPPSVGDNHRTKSTLLTKSIKDIPSYSFLSDDVKKRFELFIQIRIEKERSLSLRSIEILYNKLNKLSANADKQIEIIDRSIEGNRKSFFAIKNENANKKYTRDELINIVVSLTKIKDEHGKEAFDKEKEKVGIELRRKAVAEYNNKPANQR